MSETTLYVACDTCHESLDLMAYIHCGGECARCVSIEYCRCGEELDYEDDSDPAPESSYEDDPDTWDAWHARHPDDHPIWHLCEDCRP